MSSQDRKKVANIYISESAHSAIKRLAAHQDASIQGVLAAWLEETTPILENMADALDDIKKGEETQKTYNNYIAKGLQMAGDKLMINDEEQDDATDNGKSD